MKNIYIVVSYTGTMLSQIIKTYTRDEFSHVSIALDPELKEMYSFGRLWSYNPFWGGFVHEATDRGTFKRFYNTRVKISSYEVTDAQYEKVKETIRQIEAFKQNYKFNTIGLFAVGLHRKIAFENSFYCAEFVKYVIENSRIDMDLPRIIRPEDFKDIEGSEEVYKGLFRKYEYYRKPHFSWYQFGGRNAMSA